MPYVLALLSAALYGSADFIGGIGARRTNTIAAVTVSQLAGLAVLLVVMPLLPSSAPGTGDLAWGAGAGLAGGIGVALLYHALSVGTMAIVAPITAVCAVAIPVLVAIALGERPPPVVAGGIVLAVCAIALVSQSAPDAVPASSGAPEAAPVRLPHRRQVWLALLSGIAIGLFFVLLARTSAASGLWPLVSARTTSVVLFAGIAVATRRTVRMSGPVAALVMAGGAIDMLSNLLYLLASRTGPLSVVVTLASLYPASTVLLARIVLGERLTRTQNVGIAFAFAAVVLIVGGR